MSSIITQSKLLSQSMKIAGSFSPITIIILTTIIGLIFIRNRRRSRVVKLIEKIPGPLSLPLIGNTLESNVDHDGKYWRLFLTFVMLLCFVYSFGCWYLKYLFKPWRKNGDALAMWDCVLRSVNCLNVVRNWIFAGVSEPALEYYFEKMFLVFHGVCRWEMVVISISGFRLERTHCESSNTSMR